MEGLEISNPSHFANMTSFGGGGITVLSSQMLASSDFYTSAFPAEYGNALSGVFDIKLRSGNRDKREHTVKIGLMGIDLSSEWPIKMGKGATYLFNYRYALFGLLEPIMPENAGLIKYQDLNFKTDLLTKKPEYFRFGELPLLIIQEQGLQMILMIGSMMRIGKMPMGVLTWVRWG